MSKVHDSGAEQVAWRVLSDVLRHGDLAHLGHSSFEQLVALRLAREAERTGIAPEALDAAFARAICELTGAGGPSGDPEDASDEAPDDGIETVDDL